MPTFNNKTIEKIVATMSEKAVPIIAQGIQQQDEAFAKFKAFIIESDERLQVSTGSRSGKKNEWTKLLSVYLKYHNSYYFPSIPRIQFDELNRLVMCEEHFKQTYPIDYATFPLVINELFKLNDIEEADKKKKEKLRDLKTQGILAKFKAIADEDGFEYTYEQSTLKVVLKIKLPRNKALHIDVPFANFQEVMQNVRDLIKNVEELTGKGISFRVKG
jgi:hypothetical protein